MKKLIYALRFMTIIPIPWKEKEDLVQVSRSSGMFPAVGLIIGILLSSIGRFLGQTFSQEVTAFLQTVLWVLLTGGLHLDGLSDTFDGIGSGKEREKMLQIMSDSSIGTFGALSLILQIIWKFLFIRELNGISPWLIILPPVTGRWGQLVAIYFFPSAKKDGMGHFFKDSIRIVEVTYGLLITLAVYLFLAPIPFLLVLTAHSSIMVLISDRISRRLGGLTGDVYGLVCEIGESVTLLLMLIYFKMCPSFSVLQRLNELIHLLFQ